MASLVAATTAAAHAACSSSGPSNKPAVVREEVSAYKMGDLVEYWSVTKGGSWVSATVVGVGSDGQLVLDVKPHAWISCQEQAAKLRPRGSRSTQKVAAAGAATSLGRESGAGGKSSSLSWAAPMLGCSGGGGRRSPSPALQPFRSMSLILEENEEDLKDSSGELSVRKSEGQESTGQKMWSCEVQLQEEHPELLFLEKPGENQQELHKQQEQLDEQESGGQHSEATEDTEDQQELLDHEKELDEGQEPQGGQEPAEQQLKPAEDQQELIEHEQVSCEWRKPQGKQEAGEEHLEHVEDKQEFVEHEEPCEAQEPPGKQEPGEHQSESAEDQLKLIERAEKPCEGQEQAGELKPGKRQLQLGELQQHVSEHQEKSCKQCTSDRLEPCEQQLQLGRCFQELSEHLQEPCEQLIPEKHNPDERQAEPAEHKQKEVWEHLQEPVEQYALPHEQESVKQQLQHGKDWQGLGERRQKLCEQQLHPNEKEPVRQQAQPSGHRLEIIQQELSEHWQAHCEQPQRHCQQPDKEGSGESQLAHGIPPQETSGIQELECESGAPREQVVSTTAEGAAASVSSRRPRRWTLANVAEHRVVGAGVRRLHEVLVSQRPDVDLLELPRRPDGSSLVMQASFYRRLLGGRLEVKGCLESDISAAHMDLKHLTLEQLVSIRAESLDFLTSSESHSTHNNFLDSVDGYLAERLVQHGLQGKAEAPASALRALGRRLVLVLGAGQLLRQGWGSSAGGVGSRTGFSSGTGHLPHCWAVELDAALWPSGGGHKAALFFAEPLQPSEQHGGSGNSSSSIFRVELPGSNREAWARAAGEGTKVAIACDSSWGTGKSRRLQWEICALDPGVDDIAEPGEAAFGSMAQQQALARALATKAAEGSSSPSFVLESLLSKVPRPLVRASSSASGSSGGASSSAARHLAAGEAPPAMAAMEDAGFAEGAGGRCPRPSVAYLSGRVGLAVARLNLPAS